MKSKSIQFVLISLLLAMSMQISGISLTHISFASRIMSEEINDYYKEHGLSDDEPAVLVFSRCQSEFFKSMDYIRDNSETDLEQLERNTALLKIEIEMLDAIKGFDQVNIEFILKLDQMLKTTEPSSAVINQVLREYRTYEKSIIHEFNKMLPLSSKVSILENQRLYNVCTEDRDKALENTKQYMLNLIKSNAAKKKSARLIEKMKQINDKMQGYDAKITSFYKMMLTLKSKLPGFVATCITAKK